MNKAVIVLPTYNEAGNISKVIQEIIAIQAKTKLWKL
jgi:glycosyltransferase involved in cell wall biosynthesis